MKKYLIIWYKKYWGASDYDYETVSFESDENALDYVRNINKSDYDINITCIGLFEIVGENLINKL